MVKSNYKKLLFSALLLGTAIFISPKDAKAAGILNMKGCSDNSITVEWEQQNNPNYQVNGYSIKDHDTGQILWTGTKDQTQATIPKIKGYTGEWELLSNRTYTQGGYTLDAHVDYAYVNTTPTDMTKKDFGIKKWMPNKKKIMLDINAPENQSGVQLEVYNAKNQKILTKDSGNLAGEEMKVSLDSAYKYRVRCYYVNDSMNQTYYGNWSNSYFAMPSITAKKSSVKKGVGITLKKGTGISKYTVYISKKYDTGYKKTKTIKVSKKKTYSLYIKKYGKKKVKKGIYFVKVVPTIKDGKKTFTSEKPTIQTVCVR